MKTVSYELKTVYLEIDTNVKITEEYIPKYCQSFGYTAYKEYERIFTDSYMSPDDTIPSRETVKEIMGKEKYDKVYDI